MLTAIQHVLCGLGFAALGLFVCAWFGFDNSPVTIAREEARIRAERTAKQNRSMRYRPVGPRMAHR